MTDPRSTGDLPSLPSTDPMVIVAIGASGSAPDLLVQALTELVPSPTVAIVVAIREGHLRDEERVRAAVEGAGRVVSTMAEGDPVRAGQVFLPPPGQAPVLEDGRFRLKPVVDQGSRGVIDGLFLSMAREMDGNAIGLILGISAGDGVLGVTAVKEAGGLTLVAGVNAADELELANSSSAAALADHVLPLPAVAERVALYVKHYSRLRSIAVDDARVASEAEHLAQVASVLRNHTGHDFHGYKRATFLRRVQRRMQVIQAETLPDYVAQLRSRSDEAHQLFNDLLIGVTQFFRDPREFQFLQDHVVPRLFEGKTRSDSLRVWVLGCSTGEEAYSIAMLLREHASTLTSPPHMQIFASDIDGRGLAVARVGRYPATIAEDVTPERLDRWFTREGDTYSVSKELREMCVFSQHSIVKDPPFSRLDMISCRNLLIYLDTELQNQVIPVFHFALRPAGYLFLGTSENVSRHGRLFLPVERSYRVFQKVDAGAKLPSEFALASATERGPVAPALPRARVLSQALVRQGERIAERHAPAYAIVDEHYDVLHFSGQAGRYVFPGGGTPSLNLLNLVHRDLRLELRGALNRASTEQRSIEVDGVVMGDGMQRQVVDVVVEPAGEGQARRGFVVLFKEGSLSSMPAGDGIDGTLRDEHVKALEAELRITRERLQAMIEELESTNEELKSSNEEYQSLNEELQSANEELETSKEELQSVNEEVTTVNGELAHRVQELAHANSDLKNLLESTQIATVFLDNELRVTNFTPAVTDVLPLVETDIHRPIGHIKSHVAYDELQDDARRVIRTLTTVDREVENPRTGNRYMVRVLPYRSVDNFIGGAVVTFMDVTPLSRAEQALRDSEGRLRTLMEGIPQLVWRAEDSGRWTWSGPQWARFTGQDDATSLGLGWLDAVHPDDREATMRAWEAATGTGVLNLEHRIRDASDGTYRWFHSRCAPVRDDRQAIVEWLGTSTDIDDLRRLQDEQKVMVAELQHRTRNLLSVVQSIASQTLAATPSLDAFRNAFDGRLAALSRVQGLLSLPEGEPITLGALLRMELNALGADVARAHIIIEGPEVPLRRSAVQTLSLALHELATNARKYGALAHEGGRLEITWRHATTPAGVPAVALDWREQGLSPHTQGLPAGGFGRRLIEQALPYTLGAQTEYALNDDALRCVIVIPLRDAS